MSSDNNTTAPPHVDTKIGIVKLIVSGDTITITGKPKGGPPPERTITLSNITAPKLARKGTENEEDRNDEPWAWEAREFLRKKLIGQTVVFTEDKVIGANKIYGSIWLGKDKNSGENIAELLVAEGLVTLKLDNIRNPNPAQLRLKEAEEVAKRNGKGKWSTNSSYDTHIRDIKWNVEDPNAFLEEYNMKLCKAVVEHVRDGSTLRVLLLPDYYYITLKLSGIKCPPPINKDKERDPLGEEALYFTERRILQRDVEVIVEAKDTYSFVGMVLHPVGNIAEFLLREGLAKCVPMNVHLPATDMEKLFQAEKEAKNKKLRLWENYTPAKPVKGYIATVREIVGADSMIICVDGNYKKIFLSSIRPPQKEKSQNDAPRSKDFRPLYDIPYMFQARELLRKKLLYKSVKVIEDYVQPAKDQYPEKVCCTVMFSKTNVAEILVSKGLASVVRHRQDDLRSQFYNELLIAENLAEKNQNGIHSKKYIAPQRIIDVSNDPAKAKFHLSALKRASGAKAIVEFVSSGSRMKLFLPKEQCIITFLLAGIKVPRRSRPKPGGGGGVIEGEQFSEEAYSYTKSCCFQKDVEIDIETMETKGSGFIGWLFIDGVNLSVKLVELGFAEVSFTPNGENLKLLKAAEEKAKANKLNIWSLPRIELEIDNPDDEKEIEERKVEPREVVVSDINENLHFYAQYVDQRSQFEDFLSRLRQELETHPPLPGSFNPKRGELVAAKFTGDNQWYRAKVEKVSGTNISLFYIDYGNREVVNVTKVAPLPSEFSSEKPYAHEYSVAYAMLPKDEDDRIAAITALQEDVENKTLLLSVVYKSNGVLAATLVDPASNEDLVKALITHGYLLVQEAGRKSATKDEYLAAQKEAKTQHRNIWQYGDITADDQ